MKTIYTLKTHLMNGTVTMMTAVSNFTDKETAEEALKVIEEANKENGNDTWSEIDETILYENRDEVPILNKN